MKPFTVRLPLLFLLIGASLITFPWLGNPLPLLAAPLPPSYITQWGSYGFYGGQFINPLGIAVDSQGDVYVTDFWNHRVQKFTSNGGFLWALGRLSDGGGPTLGSNPGEFKGPWGVAVDSNDNFYVADSNNHRIQKFDSNGQFIAQWGSEGDGDGQFHHPCSVAVDSSGNIYVGDCWDGRIQKFDSNGAYLIQWTPVGAPRSIAVDSHNNVYVAVTALNRIVKFDSNGVYLTQWGEQGSGHGQFTDPQAVAVDKHDNVYVTDGNSRIQQFDTNGVYLMQWGSPGYGPGQLDIPLSIGISADDKIYVSDDYDRIQKFGWVPDIGVSGNGIGIANADLTPATADGTDFGPRTVNSSLSRSFTISNSGSADLTGLQVSVSGSNAFTLTTQPAAAILPGANTTFVLTFKPTTVGAQTATVTIASNDSDENPYTFVVQGVGATTTITILHDALPDSATNFRFSGGLGAFYLDDMTPQDMDSYSNSKSFAVAPGTYNVTEVLPSTWVLAGLVCNPAAKGMVNLSLKRVTLRVVAGDNVTCTFTNQYKATVNTLVFHDLNQNRVYNSGEPGLSGWTVSVYDGNNTQLFNGTTDAAGKANFVRQLPPNVPYKVCVDVAAGWTRTVPTALDPVLGKPCYSSTPAAGQTLTFRFGNKPLTVNAAENEVIDAVEDITSEEAPVIAPDESGYDADYVEEEEIELTPTDQATPILSQLLFLPLISNTR